MVVTPFRRLTYCRQIGCVAMVSLAIVAFTVIHEKQGIDFGAKPPPKYNFSLREMVPFVHMANWTLQDIQNRRRDPANRWTAAVATDRMAPLTPLPKLPPSARNRTRKFSKLLVYNRK
jgi:hypothetical protein